ncbi:MAG: transporter substrate-binding domain-containing protein [Geobacteraceae bacterium]|nr:transporter substrate-binding domain-containing protein [Geobacteraceae bacterium]
MPGISPDMAKRFKWSLLLAISFSLAFLAFLTLNSSSQSIDPLTTEERAWLKAHPGIRFAPDPDFPPAEFFDGNGSLNGITADYLALLEKKLGIRFKIVRLRNWDEVISYARTRQVDFFAATKTPQRTQFAFFTAPYMELPAAIIAREKVTDPLTMANLKGMKVSVVSGYAVQEYIARNYPEVNLDVVPDVQTGLRKVSFGTSDAFLENLGSASYYIEREGFTNLRVAGEFGYSYRMAFASRKDWPILNRILSKGLEQISADEKKSIYRKWIPLEPRSLFARKGIQTALIAIAVAVIVLVTGIIVWNRALARRVSARTCELVRELAERKRVEDELRESEEKFRVLADTLPVGIFLYQGEMIVYVNAATVNLFGYSEQECLQMRFWDWAHEDYSEKVRERGLARQRGEQVQSRYECRHVSKFGDERWLFVSAGRIEYRGEAAGIATFIDITDRKRMVEELQEAHGELEKRVEMRTSELTAANELLQHEITVRKQAEEQLRQKKELLEELNDTLEKRVREEVAKNRQKDIVLVQQNRQAAMGEMLDHIAHQWKQPITSLSLIVQDMAESWSNNEMSDESVEEAVGTAMSLLEHMSQTIDVFRNFYRPDKERKEFNIKDSIDQALTFIAPALKFHRISIELEADPDMAAIGYPNEYTQVLLNILTNARDAVSVRGVENPIVTIKAFAESNRAVVTIMDNAGGIPETIIGKVFELYFSTREPGCSSGVGLYMSKNIIERNMGGILTVANADHGARFRIELDMPNC